MFGFLPSLEQVVACHCQGAITPANLSSALDFTSRLAASVLPAVQQELVMIFQRKKSRDNQN